MEEKILALYELGHGKDKISQELGCTSADVRAVLMKHNKKRTHKEVVALRRKNNLFSHHGNINKKTAWDY